MKILDLGAQPVSNRFIKEGDRSAIPEYPLGLIMDEDSGIIRLDPAMPFEELRPRVPWIKAFEPEDHLDDLVSRLLQLPGITKSSTFFGYSFKDESTLRRISSLGYEKIWQIDPRVDLHVFEENAGIETYQAMLNLEAGIRIREKYGAPDVLILRHVIEHSFSLDKFLEFIKAVVNTNGYLVIELPDCTKPLQGGDCTMIWEEHLFYFTKNSFENLLITNGFEIVDFYEVEYPLENCMIAIVKNIEHKESHKNIFKSELGLANNYRNLFLERKDVIRELFEKIANKGLRVAAFGAGHYTIAFLAYMDLARHISFVIDDDLNKIGYRLPLKSNILINTSELLNKDNIDLCLLGLNPAHHEKVIKKHEKFSNEGGRFASIFPNSSLDILSLDL
ncbi:class I SAM-dependent methyltransferase [Polynucleobacter sp. IMCC30063]|uniref:methyltransferase domain-containing protein n=1 Tax=Polynucleobacter sp. IMCC30063 TaxID=2907298 RepID=UPI001F2AA287|nr:methyltransferase domain-containing protein [Polynucleobacter sp. IMCC30063]MCE7505295.1 class I SAM-dependent methyltransferase [Polynucleobacter sp. IMCC30063]